MTRRAGKQAAHVLSLNAYVHRATVGLPRADRLDAAAELRAHLLERVAALEGQGYARDEAEHLAVRAMGDPGATNRQLLGHFFTTPVGWLTLGAVLMIGGGVWATQGFRPAGIWPSTPRSMDDTAINRIVGSQWPRPLGSAFGSWTRTADLRFPKGTRHVFAAWMSYGDADVRSSFTWGLGLPFDYSTEKSAANTLFDPDLWQSRLRLVATAAPDMSGKTCPEGKYQSGTLLYSQDRPKLPPGVSINNQDSITIFENLLGGFCMKDMGNFPEVNSGPLILKSWSKAYQIWGTVDKKQISYALLFYPTDQEAPPKIKAEQAYTFRPDVRAWELIKP